VTAEAVYKKTVAAPAAAMRRFMTITRYQSLKLIFMGCFSSLNEIFCAAFVVVHTPVMSTRYALATH
jgi:hypothetical protein